MIAFANRDIAEMVRQAFVFRQDSGEYLVYPNLYFGQGYLIGKETLEDYLYWHVEVKRKVKGLRKLAFLIVMLLLFLSINVLWVFVISDLSDVIFIVSACTMFVAIDWFTKIEFRENFPDAVRTKARRPWRRIFQGLLVTRSHTLWKVLTTFLAVTVLVLWQISALILIRPDYPRLNPLRFLALDAMFWMIVGTLLLALGYLLFKHLDFRRRHGRAPRPEDLGNLL